MSGEEVSFDVEEYYVCYIKYGSASYQRGPFYDSEGLEAAKNVAAELNQSYGCDRCRVVKVTSMKTGTVE